MQPGNNDIIQEPPRVLHGSQLPMTEPQHNAQVIDLVLAQTQKVVSNLKMIIFPYIVLTGRESVFLNSTTSADSLQNLLM